MCEQCPTEHDHVQPDTSRRRLLKWGLAVPVAAAAATVPLASGAGAQDLSIEVGRRQGGAFYVAQSGDTLRSIAKQWLGNEQRWTELLALNERELGRDKEPRQGQRLALPASPDGGRTRTFAPLPATSRPVPFPPEGYRLDKLGDRAYGVIVGSAQSMFVVTDTGVIVLDAPAGHAALLPQAIKKVTDKPVTHFIYSHSHTDHVGAADRFPDAIRIAHAETARTLALHKDPARPMPTVTFQDKHTVDVGGQRLLLSYPGPNHEAGNILVHSPQQRFAFMTDVASPGFAPFRAFGTADSAPGVLRAHNELVKLDIDTFVGGHMHRYGTKKDLVESREFVFDMWAETGKAIAATPIAEFFAKVEPGNVWAAVELWTDAITDKAEAVILKKWIGRLGAVDVWTRENIKTMIISQRVDQPKDLV